MIGFQPGIDRPNNNTQGIIRDVVFRHNTGVSATSTPCWGSIYFGAGSLKPPLVNLTQNIWVLDNALCRQPTGDWGFQGTTGLTQYMGVPGLVDTRFRGNVMYVPIGDRVQIFPAHNYNTTVPFSYAAPSAGDYQLVSPYWTDTSDGKLAGISYKSLANPDLSSSNSPIESVTAGASAVSVGTSGYTAPLVQIFAKSLRSSHHYQHNCLSRSPARGSC